MTTLFVGDVHSCAHELNQLLQIVQPERVILLGDIFNKGPDPERTWALVQAWNAEAVLGNHDVAMIEYADANDLRIPGEAVAWLRTLPLTIEGPGWIAVHGGLPPDGSQLSKQQAICLRRWPNDRDKDNPFWWELYSGNRLVLYGHDAVRGLQDHRPKTLGLDTGCVYGKYLTGYCLEEDRIIQVPAATQYQVV